jgi:hypothetical protein
MSGSETSGFAGARAVVAGQVGTVARHPELWSTALRQLVRLAPAGWWRRPPFLPVPAPDYTSFRMLTQYGDAAHRPEAGDVLNYLRWCKAWNSHGRT